MAFSPAQPPLASKAPWWLLACYVVGTLIALTYAAMWSLVLINTGNATRPVENFVLNGVVWEAALAVLGLQATALVGLYTRRHWGRAIATVAAGLWIFTVIGIPFAVLAWWGLHRRWVPGVDSTFTRDHPSAPAYLTGLAIVGVAAVLVWLWFLYLYLPALLNQLAPAQPVSGWYWIVTIGLFFSLPLWIVQALAVVGLLQKHDWGAVLAMITCVLWIMSIVGLPFGIAGLFVLWRWQHPALRPAQRSAAPA